MQLRPYIPKKLAARIRAAQAKVLDARGWIEATTFNSLQDEARWKEYMRNPEAFAQKHYPGHSVNSYPVQTNISRLREKLDRLPAQIERNQQELEEADANLTKVEEDVFNEVARLRPSSGRVPWPTLLEPYEAFYRRAMATANHQRDTADAQRDAYLTQVQQDFDCEIAALDAERDFELKELAEKMKLWPREAREKYREVISSIADGLHNGTLSPSDVGKFVKQKLEQL